MAAGGGSMQLVQGSEVFVLEQGFREGQAELMGSRPRHAVCADLEARALNRCRVLYRTDYISFLYPIRPISFVVPVGLNLVRYIPYVIFFIGLIDYLIFMSHPSYFICCAHRS